ncbi:hypothetical protein FHT08_002030 [Xanthomonas campestris]|uniref:hypothetical protein n=1 Tax=Xanthomonas TaxID=338 RepID=UPI001ABA33E7|nr:MULTISPECIES: hypothetical protein [Xanthomonas]NIJ76947.1 hypothetical protein [Xanthomonas sp. CFBP 8151]
MTATATVASGASVSTTPGCVPDTVPLWRLYGLRAGYLLLVVGLGVQVWPDIVLRHGSWELMEGVVQCMLGAMGLLALLGLRYPLKLLPLLLFEIAWKLIWLGMVATPRLLLDRMDAGTWSTLSACLLVVVFPIVIPWRYVASMFIRMPGDRWR